MLHLSPANSPARPAAAHDSPPYSPATEDARPARPALARVASGVMDIPSPAEAEEDTRALLVGPSQLPQAQAEPGPQTEEEGSATPGGSARKLGPGDFLILSLVGQGAFGKVFQVQRRDTTRVYAMKVLRKAVVLEKNQAEYTRTERDVLTRVEHPFIVTLHHSFQTSSKLYLILDFINGGHLFFQLYRAGIFDEALARVYTAELVLALTHLHSLGIVHRGAPSLLCRPLHRQRARMLRAARRNMLP